MKLVSILVAVALAPTSAFAAVALPPTNNVALVAPAIALDLEPDHDLWKRKGGGGGRGGGGGSRSGGSSGGSSRTSSSSNAGGRTSSGSGTKPSYGGGRFYSGGSTVPYTAGSKSPGRSINPVLAGVAAGLAFGFIISSAAHSWYFYNWPERYTFHNATTNATETDNVICGCQQYGVCGCDYTEDTSYLASIVGDGSMAALDTDVASVAEYEGATTIFIDGTLPNGTTAEGAASDLIQPVSWWSALVLGTAIAWML